MSDPIGERKPSRRQLLGWGTAALIGTVGVGDAAAVAEPAHAESPRDHPALVLHYAWKTPPKTSYGAGCLVTVNWWGSRQFPREIAKIRSQDAEVLEYTLPVHDYRRSSTDVPEQVRFYTRGRGGHYARHKIPRSWYWDHKRPGRVHVPAYSGHVMDLRAGSAWFEHLLHDYYPWRLANPKWNLDGFLLDVIGDGYLGWISGASHSELKEMKHGMRWFVRKLRSVVGKDCLLINNNLWTTPNNHINGILVENHDGGEIGDAFWRKALANTTRKRRRRNCTINDTAAEADKWAVVPGVDLAGHSGGDYEIGPAVRGLNTVAERRRWRRKSGHIHLWDSTTFHSDGGRRR